MNWDVIKGTAATGSALALFLCLFIASSIYCQITGQSHPLEGGNLAVGILLGSPVIVLFQVLAIIMTLKSDLHGAGRVAVLLLNIVGLLVGLWIVMILSFFVRMGPINPG